MKACNEAIGRFENGIVEFRSFQSIVCEESLKVNKESGLNAKNSMEKVMNEKIKEFVLGLGIDDVV